MYGYFAIEEYERCPFPMRYANDNEEIFIYVEKAMDVWMGRQLYHVYIAGTGTKAMTCDAETIQSWGVYPIKYETVFPKEVSNA